MIESLFQFVETTVFRKRLDKLADLNLLFAIQADLLENPKLGAVIPGTNGARKARIGDPTQNRGKRGAFRYIYVFFEVQGIIYLLFMFAKNEQADMTSEQKREVAEFINHTKRVLGED